MKWAILSLILVFSFPLYTDQNPYVYILYMDAHAFCRDQIKIVGQS